MHVTGNWSLLKPRILVFVACAYALGCTEAVPEAVFESASQGVTFEALSSPSNNSSPNVTINGLLPNGSVDLYLDSSCSGTSIGSGLADANGQGVVTAVLGADGVHQIYADHLGKCSTNYASYELDTMAPAPPSGLSLVSPAASPGNVSSPVVQVAGVASGDLVELFSNGTCSTLMGTATATGATVNITSNILGSDGGHTYWARTTDAALNSSGCSSVSLTYSLDTLAPNVLGLADDAVVTNAKTWNWSCSETCTFRYLIDQAPATAPSGAYSAVTSATQNTGNGTFYIHVQALDSAGNPSAVVHVSAVLDTTSPAIPTLNYAVGTVTPSSTDSTPSFTVGNLTVGDTVQIFKNSSCFSVADTSTPAPGASFDMTPTAITTEGYKYYSVNVVDGSGNTSGCSSSILYLYDATPPPAPTGLDDGAGTASSTASPAIRFNNSTDVSGVSHEARIVRVSDLVAMSGWVFVNSGDLIGGLTLAAGITYRAEVRAVNGTGLISASAIGDGFVLDTTAPATAPGTLTLGAVPNYLNRTPTVTFIDATDPESGIDGYQVQVHLASDNSIVVPWVKMVGGNGGFGLLPIMLQNQVAYYLVVRGINGSGLPGPVSPPSLAWTAGCNTTNLNVVVNSAYSTSEGHFCFVVPAGITVLTVKAWGGGGGGAVSTGGAGGFSSADVPVSPGELITVTVGGGGERGDTAGGGMPGYGGGGRGSPRGTGNYLWGAGGGGYSGIFRAGAPLLLAAGGGGGQGDVTSAQAGPGGGLTGLDDSDPVGGKGGTQVAGGNGGNYCGSPGAYLQGGDAGVTATNWGGGGGGGGGYFGGGGGCRGGTSQSSSGGGGSSYLDAILANTLTISGSANIPGNGGDPDRTLGGPANVGAGGSGVQDGGPGKVVIYW